MDQESQSTKESPSTFRRWGLRIGYALIGICVALGIAEVVFFWRDAGAFPHVNFYQLDSELAVKLQPNSSMRFKLGDNPVTEIQVGEDGFRGEKRTPRYDILIVGDSQVFGLGVNDDETLAAGLAEETGQQVFNGGVPTYGPS